MSDFNYLFVGGCPRSGTTAMVGILNIHPLVMVGRERYRFMHKDITPECFEPQRFFNPVAEEARFRDKDFYGELRQRWETGRVRYVGDKYPDYAQIIPTLRERFANSRFIVLLRELDGVVASYESRRLRDPHWIHGFTHAVQDWNLTSKKLLKAVKQNDSDIYPVVYERLFSGDEAEFRSLYGFLSLDPDDDALEAFRQRTRGWSKRRAATPPLPEEIQIYLKNHGDFERQNELWEHAQRARYRWGPPDKQLGGVESR